MRMRWCNKGHRAEALNCRIVIEEQETACENRQDG